MIFLPPIIPPRNYPTWLLGRRSGKIFAQKGVRENPNPTSKFVLSCPPGPREAIKIDKMTKTFLYLLIIFTLLTQSVFAQQKKKGTELLPVEEAGLLLVAMTKKGWITYYPDDTGFI